MADPKNVHTNQPMGHGNASNPFLAPTVQWSVGLFDCCDNMGDCCCAWICLCCFMHSLGKSINEDSILGCCITSQIAVYRMKIRSVLHIEGSALNDCMTASCCGVCTAVQMKSELKNRGLA
ncbi:unnamed protein product [Adineta ricciae]|uniref:Uncharacterized protein n=2 Tax=Adineta ricciae TaxID=249248 RepID=A0A814AVJ5_ADIRI|nr:unnamed protein product [Adineta ricciae]